METIQFVGACIGYTVSAITLITLIVTLIVKPIRSKLIGWIKGVNSTDTTAETLQKIETRLKKLEDKIDKIGQGSQANLRNDILQLVDVCIAKGFITSLEKRNLKDMYKAYHDLGGDTYATVRYELALGLPEKN